MAPVCLICADDLILFSGASMDQADAMRDCLDSFACQEVSYDKSRLFCSPNVDEDLASSLSIICGSPLTTNLGKYLSPLPHFFAAHFTAFSASGRALSPIIYLSVGPHRAPWAVPLGRYLSLIQVSHAWVPPQHFPSVS